MARRKYTVWVQHDTGLGTVWVDTITCRTRPDGLDDIPHIERVAVAKCAREWEIDSADDLLCMGIARGAVRILLWDDTHYGDI